jgi:unsaturated chondroitin disaccharide hydrolase
MAIKIDSSLTEEKLLPAVYRLFELSAEKILLLEKSWRPSDGAPVFTVNGKYRSRGWTEWTQGFQFGSALLQFDATADEGFLEMGRRHTIKSMATHVSHMGVHDHGFNNISTYGNLWRLMREGRIAFNERENDFYELALKVSGAVQASRWTSLPAGEGYIYSFNGPHSLFIDTLRSLRVLALAHQLGHVLMGEGDQQISLLARLLAHARTTVHHNIFFGEGRDTYDVPGRTAHESIFNLNDGSYRCPSSQQGYSPFSTWTRGLAWAIQGLAEQLEFLSTIQPGAAVRQARELLLRAASVTGDFYLANCCRDGVPMWDTGAPNLYRLGEYLNRPADPLNHWEPVDSSAAAIAAQGLLRLGNYLADSGRRQTGRCYRLAGLTIARTLLAEPYLSTSPRHQGLLLHSVYHRPAGWDCIPPGGKVPNGESSMWGDYHLRELALMILRHARGEAYLTFFGGRLVAVPDKRVSPQPNQSASKPR